MQASRSPVRYKLSHPVNAVKLEEHPGSTLRDPTGTLVEIPANAVVEPEGIAAPSGLINILWAGNAYSVLYDDLKEKAQLLGAASTRGSTVID